MGAASPGSWGIPRNPSFDGVKTMDVLVKVTRAELAEMQTTEDGLKEGVVRALDAGIEDGDGTLYLSGFRVILEVEE